MKGEPRYIDASRIDMNQQTLYDYEIGKWVHIFDIPTVDVEPIRHGHWIDASSGYAFNFCCSECGFIVHEQFILNYKYCPNCGANMDERKEDYENN